MRTRRQRRAGWDGQTGLPEESRAIRVLLIKPKGEVTAARHEEDTLTSRLEEVEQTLGSSR